MGETVFQNITEKPWKRWLCLSVTAGGAGQGDESNWFGMYSHVLKFNSAAPDHHPPVQAVLLPRSPFPPITRAWTLGPMTTPSSEHRAKTYEFLFLIPSLLMMKNHPQVWGLDETAPPSHSSEMWINRLLVLFISIIKDRSTSFIIY